VVYRHDLVVGDRGHLAGIALQPEASIPTVVVAAGAAFLLGIVNLLLRPLILLSPCSWAPW